MEADIRRNQELIELLKRRRHERERQLAQLGVNADPIIHTEIADITNVIQRLEREIIDWRSNHVKSVGNSHNNTNPANNRVEYFTHIIEYIELLNQKVGSLSYEVYKSREYSRDFLTNLYNVTEILIGDMMEDYAKFVVYYGKIRLFIPGNIDDLVSEYKSTFLAGGMMKNNPTQYVSITPQKLQKLLDNIVKAMQQYIEKHS